MRKMVLLSLALLTGCATTSSSQKEQVSQSAFESKEEMLLKTGSSTQLIQLYKNKLKEGDSQEIRLKLIEAYLADKDYESAGFHLDLLQKQQPDPDKPDDTLQAKVSFLQAKVLLEQGRPANAADLVKQAMAREQVYPEAENLMGLIQAELGDFARAREYFNRARQHYYDDVIVKNNLAVLDLIEENYQAAVEKLQPLYQKGLADNKITANLVLAYAKLGNYSAVEDILKKQDYTSDEIRSVFIGLKVSDNIISGRLHQKESPVSQVTEQKTDPVVSIPVVSIEPKDSSEPEEVPEEENPVLIDSENTLALMLEEYIQQEARKNPDLSENIEESELNETGERDEAGN
ncbi:hypothetical protein DI392_02835 [Vibrio albus]|uniref:Uncharacterized protein n=1 Tax=Vibrio albus TaxID=2200953 RepID=A0A2U3BEK7_9VIBR|nr:tetratricopeptide repeat protein [Vibrio albus]PWI35218.1 hypothetical protein DI392_02835 [Vibrio albus]